MNCSIASKKNFFFSIRNFNLLFVFILLLQQSKTVSAQTFAWAKQYNLGSGPYVGKYGGMDAAGNYYAAGKDFITKHSPAGTLIWVKQFLNFTSVHYNNQFNAIAVDAAGNVFMAGSFTGTYDFDPGPGVNNLTSASTVVGGTDGFVEKLDANGNFVWAGAVGGPGGDFIYSICLDGSGNVCLTGKYGAGVNTTTYADFDPGVGQYLITSNGHYDKFIEKLDGNSNFLWAKSFGGPLSDNGLQIAADANNDIFLSGHLNGTTYLDKFDANGNTIWSKELFATTGPSIVDISIDNMGNVLSTGTFSGTYDFDPGPGVYNITGMNGQYFFVWKLDNAGNFIWAKACTVGASMASSSIATDGTGNVYTAGYHSGTGNHDLDPGTGTFNFKGSGMFIQKLNASGNFVWALSMAGTGSAMAYGRAVQVNASGDVYTFNPFAGTVDFDPGRAKYTLNASNGPFVVHKMTQAGGGNFAKPDLIVSETLPAGILIYPNPVVDQITIRNNNNKLPGNLVIYDAYGKMVYQKLAGSSQTIDVRQLSAGVYYLKTDKSATAIKFVKQ